MEQTSTLRNKYKLINDLDHISEQGQLNSSSGRITKPITPDRNQTDEYKQIGHTSQAIQLQ